MSSKNLYELSFFETGALKLTSIGEFIIQSFNFIQIDFEYQKLFNKEIVNKALQYLQKRHPFLRGLVKFNNENKRYFIEIKENPTELIKLVWQDWTDQECSIKRIIKDLEKFNEQLFDYDKELLWRVKVIVYTENNCQKYVLSLVIPTIITDGFNIQTLGIELVNIINSLLKGEECEEMRITLPLGQSIHEMCDKYNMATPEIYEFIKKFNKRQKKSLLIPAKFRPNTDETGFKINIFKLDQEITSKIVEMTRVHKLRVTGYLSACAVYALKKLFEENELEFPEEIMFEIAVSFRLRYKNKLSYQQMGDHVTLVDLETEKSLNEIKDIWEYAFYLHNLIQENCDVRNGTLYAFSHDYEELESLSNIFDQALNDARLWDILSNEKKATFA